MKKKMIRKLFSELLKNSRRSDRELARVLGVSQPTVSRMRRRLVEEGVIKEFTIIPDFAKLGYEIMAIICFKSRMKEEVVKRAIKSTMAKPNIILAAGCEGMGKNGVVISMHKNYSDYSKFLTGLMFEGGDDVQAYDTLLIGLGGRMVKPFSLKYLAELEET